MKNKPAIRAHKRYLSLLLESWSLLELDFILTLESASSWFGAPGPSPYEHHSHGPRERHAQMGWLRPLADPLPTTTVADPPLPAGFGMTPKQALRGETLALGDSIAPEVT